MDEKPINSYPGGDPENVESPSQGRRWLPASDSSASSTTRERRTRLVAVLLLFVFLLFFWLPRANLHSWSCHLTRVGDGKYDTLMTEYMKHGNSKPEGPLRGSKAEELFLTVPNQQSALAASRQYSSKPHLSGTDGDMATATDFFEHLQMELGINQTSELPIYPAGTNQGRSATLNVSTYNEPKAWITTYYPALNFPLNHSLEVLGEDGHPVWTAELEEISDGTDPEATEYAMAVPVWHGLSYGGAAQGKLVYANYGRKEDYDVLVGAGTDFNGKIVIVRYGGNYRGLKVKGAEELGAAAVLMYSDPRDDGTVTTENGYLPYPHGPARNPNSVQRGSVEFLSIYPGDPSTPGYPAYENSTRVEAINKPTIPSLPISWANAKILLDKIGNSNEGPTIRVVNNVEEKITPIWNVFGVIPGHITDEVVVLGNHRDGVLGAADPTSGTVSVYEAIRGFGALMRSGWKPLRTILIASWDGEEYGLVGSVEWGEDFANWVREHVVAYINLDTSVSGSRLSASASPLLSHLLRSTAEQIPHPTVDGRSLWDARLDDGELFGSNLDAEAVAVNEQMHSAADSNGIQPLGSGSDYSVFLQHIGVASSEAGFSPTLHDPVYHYHSIFDSPHWQELYGDPTFSRHVAIAKHIGLQVLRLSGDIILPFNTTHYAFELESYLDRVEQLSVDSSLEVDFTSLRQLIHALQASSVQLDTEKTEAELNLKKVLKKWKKQRVLRRKLCRKISQGICKLAKYIGKECQVPEDGGSCTNFLFPRRRLLEGIERVQNVNAKLIAFERGFISKEGIKDREWYKHLGVAPGKWTGYGATTLPGITEAITMEGDAQVAKYEVERLEMRISGLIDRM